MFSQSKLNFKISNCFLPEITHEQEEPDSAFEATQYFFEDITPETSIGKDVRSFFLFSVHRTCIATFLPPTHCIRWPVFPTPFLTMAKFYNPRKTSRQKHSK